MFSIVDEGMAIGLIILLLIVLLTVIILPTIFFLLHLQKLLNKCSATNRTMEPGLVWLNLIPLFNWGWIFYTIFKITESLKAEFKERNLEPPDDANFSHSIGLAYCIINVCSIPT